MALKRILSNGYKVKNRLSLLMEGQQQIISSLKEVLYKAIQFQHIYLYLFWRSHFDLSCKMNILALQYLKKIFLYTLYADDITLFLKQEKSVIE